MTIITGLFVALGVFTIYYLFVAWGGVKTELAAGETLKPTPIGLITGFVTNFFDTLGIGSFATTTTIFRATKEVRDEKMPGTLNVGHTLPTVVEALAFIAAFKTAIDGKTLVSMIIAATAGAFLGARVFGGWPRRKVQIGMGLALLGAVSVMFFRTWHGDLEGGAATELSGTLLIVGLVGNFVLGMLMTLGIGLYAPCMIMISLLGMNPGAAFPVMMGSCAFLMPVATRNFVKQRSFDLKACMGLMIGGIPGVLIAAFLVKSLPLTTLKWLVMAVVTYTAISLLMTAKRERDAAANLAPATSH